MPNRFAKALDSRFAARPAPISFWKMNQNLDPFPVG
jgi:hypothetical protein